MKRKSRMKWAAKAMAFALAGAAAFGTAAPAAMMVASAESIVTPAPTSGSLTIKKYEDKGEGDTTVPVSGVTYTLYKVMSLTPGKTAGEYADYEVVSAFSNVLKDVKPDDLGNYSAEELEALYLELKAAAVTNNVASISIQTGADGVAKAEGLDLGYYLVVESDVPAGYVGGKSFLVAVPSTNNYNNTNQAGTAWVYDVEAKPKNEKITIDKEITKADSGNGLDEDVQDGTLTVGDYVQYTVTTAIPGYTEEYFYNGQDKTTIQRNVTYTVTDTLSSGLTIQQSEDHPVVVKVNNQEIQPGVDNSNYELTVSPGVTADQLKIVFTTAFIKDHSGQPVEVTYYAQINNNAVMGEKGNENTVKLTYTNDPHTDSGDHTETITDEEKTYTFGINVVKFTNETEAKPLAGAEFKLYTDADCKTEALSASAEATNTDGILSFARLDEGVYYLKETKSPEGYTLLTNPIKVEITAVRGVDGKPMGSFTLKVDDKEITTASGNYVTQLSQNSGIATIAVENHRGFTLPATGGMGIILFLVIGAAGIIAISVILLKKSKEES